jgi:hypothetical protein
LNCSNPVLWREFLDLVVADPKRSLAGLGSNDAAVVGVDETLAAGQNRNDDNLGSLEADHMKMRCATHANRHQDCVWVA